MTAVMTKFVDAGKNRRYLVEDLLNKEVFEITVISQWLVLSKPWYRIFHNSKFNPNNWRKKSSIRYKWLTLWVLTLANFSKFFYNEIKDISSLFNRFDVITNRYFEGSLKEGTWEVPGSGKKLIIIFSDCSEIPRNLIS